MQKQAVFTSSNFPSVGTTFPSSTNQKNGQRETAVGPPGIPPLPFWGFSAQAAPSVLPLLWRLVQTSSVNIPFSRYLTILCTTPRYSWFLPFICSLSGFLDLGKTWLQPPRFSCERSLRSASFTEKWGNRTSERPGGARGGHLVGGSPGGLQSPACSAAGRLDYSAQRSPRLSRLQDGGAQGWLGPGHGHGHGHRLGQQRRGGSAIPGGRLGLRCAGGGAGGAAPRWGSATGWALLSPPVWAGPLRSFSCPGGAVVRRGHLSAAVPVSEPLGGGLGSVLPAAGCCAASCRGQSPFPGRLYLLQPGRWEVSLSLRNFSPEGGRGLSFRHDS